jgi:hypothetical protein
VIIPRRGDREPGFEIEVCSSSPFFANSTSYVQSVPPLCSFLPPAPFSSRTATPAPLSTLPFQSTHTLEHKHRTNKIFIGPSLLIAEHRIALSPSGKPTFSH